MTRRRSDSEESNSQDRAPAARVGLVGIGTVGGALIRRLTGRPLGTVRLVRVCGRPGRTRPASLPPQVDWTERFEDLLADDIDIVVELVGGLDPAYRWVRAALDSGKAVVTANKQLLAEHGRELRERAAIRQRPLVFEAAVGGGIPVIRAIGEGLAGDEITGLVGILNGTCNYILTRIESSGVSFDKALKEAQAKGYAEADPTADIEGHDARAKLAILCDVALHRHLAPGDIPCRSIADTGPAEFAAARAAGHTIRQVARAEAHDDGRVTASVGPEWVSLASPLARVEGCENVVVTTGRYGGDTSYAGRGAGGDATAVAVVSDLLAVAATLHPHRNTVSTAPAPNSSVVTAGQASARPFHHSSTC